MNKYILFISSFLLFMFSCNSPSKLEDDHMFNYPLCKEIEQLPKDDYKSQINIVDKYLKIADRDGYDEGKAHCYIYLANFKINIGEFNSANALLKEASEILQNSKNSALKANLYNAYALLNYRMNFISRFALGYNDKAIFYIKKCNKEEWKMYQLDKIYQVRADFFATNEKTDSALVYLHKALVNYSTPLNRIRTKASLVELYLVSGKLDSAGAYVEQIQKTIKDIKGQKEIHVYAYNVSGRYYTEANQYVMAEKVFKEALKIDSIITNNHLTPFLYYNLQELYKKNGERKKELYYADLFQKSNEKMYKDRDKAMNPVQDNLILNIKESEALKLKSIRISIGLLCLLIVVIAFLSYRYIKILKFRKGMLRTETESLKVKVHDKQLDEVIELAKKNDPVFLVKFSEVYPNFISELQKINPNLESSEIMFCAMIRLNFSSKEIANYMFIQHSSAQKRKSRLRKKLNIPSDIDMYIFFSNLDGN
ncbi:hypothetical protein CMT48_13920 [Elizabethkingia anophelis]|nr:hypothetical protein [Elizabethkingia anophelis]